MWKCKWYVINWCVAHKINYRANDRWQKDHYKKEYTLSVCKHTHTEEEMLALLFPILAGFPASVPSAIFPLLTQWPQLRWLCGQHWGRERRKLRFCLHVTLLWLCVSVTICYLISHHREMQQREREVIKNPSKIPDISTAKHIFWLLIQLYCSISYLMIHFSAGSLSEPLQGYL